MKYIILPLVFLAACSSTKEKVPKEPVISNESFKKERPLSNTQVPDYYQGTTQALSPALQDETLDRLSSAELAKVSSPDPLVEIAVRCSRKDFQGAFSVAERSFGRYQKVAAYWNLVANCHLNQGSQRKALLFYNKALEVQKNYVPALNNIGVMYARQGQDQKALVAFERAQKEGKFSKTPRYNLAKLYLAYGLADSSLPIFQSLLSEAPQDVDLLNAVASSYFIQSDYGRALSYYQKIPQPEWKRAEIGLNLAMTLKKLGQTKEANQVFGIIESPQTSELKQYYALIKSQLGDG